MPPHRKQLIEEFMGSVRALGRALWADRADCFKHYKLHPGQVRVLYFVLRQQHVAVKDVAKVLGTSASAATQLVDSLVKAGFLARVSDPSDRRRVVLTLSAKGRAKFEKFRGEHLAMVAKAFTPLTDGELSTLIRIHRKVAEYASR